MSKVRVHEYAKKVNKTSKEVIEQLAKINLPVKNHMAVIDALAVSKLDSVFKQAAEPTTAKKSPDKSPAKTVKNAQVHEQGQKKKQHDHTQERQHSASINQQPRKTNNATGQSQSQQGEKLRNEKGNQNRNMTQNNNNNRKGGNTQNSNNKGGNTQNSNNKGGNAQNNKGGYQQRRKPGINGGKRRTHRPAPQPVVQKELPEKITFYESLSVAELAKKLHREPSEIIKKLFMLGVMATINQELDKDAIELICADYGVDVEEEIRIDKTDLDTYFDETIVEVDENALEEVLVLIVLKKCFLS